MSEKTALTKTSGKKGKESVTTKPKENLFQSINSPVEQILHLQQTIGNRAVQRMIKSGTLQAKLKIGKSNDKYEQEADRVADKVMSMPEPHEAKKLLANSYWSLGKQVTPLIQKQEKPEEGVEVKTKLQRQPNAYMYSGGELATDPDLKSVKLTSAQLNKLKQELLSFLNKKWQRKMGKNPKAQNRPPYRHLLNGLVQGGVKINKWAYLIAQSERENLGRRQPGEEHQNEFNIIVNKWFNEIKDLRGIILNRKPVMKWMKEALEAFKAAGGRIPTGFNPAKALHWFKLNAAFKAIATPPITPGPTGIATAAYLLLAYTSNQLYIAFQPWVIRRHNRNTIRQMNRAMSQALRKVKKAQTLVAKIQFPKSLLGRQRKIAPPEIRWHHSTELLLARTKLTLQNGIKKLKSPQSNLPAAKSKLLRAEFLIYSASLEIDNLISSTENFNSTSRWRMRQANKYLKVGKKKLFPAKKLNLAAERFAKLNYVNRAALAFLASTGNLNISGMKEARRFFSTGRTSRKAASQFRKFTKSIRKIRGEIKRLLPIILETRPAP